MARLRGRIDLELVTNPTRAKKLISKPTTQHWDTVTDNLVAIKKQKPNIFIDRPIYLGFYILDLSKIVMYQFQYETILPKYGVLAKIAYTDTESFIYHIQTSDIYKDMVENLHVRYVRLLDRPPLYSKKNGKLLGRMKDEYSGKASYEFLGRRSQMFSILLPHNKDKFTAKGVSCKYILKHLQHADYLRMLQNKDNYCDIYHTPIDKTTIENPVCDKTLFVSGG